MRTGRPDATRYTSAEAGLTDRDVSRCAPRLDPGERHRIGRCVVTTGEIEPRIPESPVLESPDRDARTRRGVPHWRPRPDRRR